MVRYDHQRFIKINKFKNPWSGRMVKAPPVNPRDYISQTSIISLREGHKYVLKYVLKSFKNRKKVDN